MRAATTYQRGLAVFAFFTLAAGDFWRYLLSWWGWGAIALLVVVLATIELVRSRTDVRRLPAMLLAFVGFAALSIIWSAYPGASALGVVLTLATTVVATFLPTGLSWGEPRETFSDAAGWILGLSLLFELFVAAVIQPPVLPLWV